MRVNDDPLSVFKREVQREKADLNEDEQDQNADANGDSAAATITHKLGQNDPLADFHKLEVLMLSRNEFETWDQRKLKIFAQFKAQTDGREIIIDERRDRDTDRIIRMGQGKSRMDQLQTTSTSKGGVSSRAQMMSAQDFTN